MEIAFFGLPDGTCEVNDRIPREIGRYRKGSDKKILRRAIEHLNDEAYPETTMILAVDLTHGTGENGKVILRVYKHEEIESAIIASVPYVCWDGVIQGETIDKGWSTHV